MRLGWFRRLDTLLPLFTTREFTSLHSVSLFVWFEDSFVLAFYCHRSVIKSFAGLARKSKNNCFIFVEQLANQSISANPLPLQY
jgi:hypothetical protein